jgi:hypothetical protein
MGFGSLAEAEQATAGLVAQGRKIAIFDNAKRRIIKDLP